MYFNSQNNNKEYKNKSINMLDKKYIIIVVLIVIFILLLSIFLMSKEENVLLEKDKFLVLSGAQNMVIYQGSEYIEPGYQAYDSDNDDLSKQVIIESNLNINEIGEYEIVYKLDSIKKVRKVIVVEIPKEYTFLNLNSVNGDNTVYLNVGEEYVEPGYEAFNSSGVVLTDMVKIESNVDVSKKGFYLITYSITDIYGVVITKTRDVIVMDMNIKLSLSNNDYTNSGVEINIEVEDDYFSYIMLPNNTKITDKVYQYIVTENGTYTFMVYNTFGSVKSASIQVNNVDKIKPSGSCTIEQFNDYSSIKINASDNIGVDRYIYNNKEYIQDSIKVSSLISDAQIRIYDKANNYTDINCKVEPKVYISNIKNDGVIVTVNAKKINSNISGYYFSYTNQIPSKSTGGYISTNLESIDVVRLPGTTYVWVEDDSGKISQVKTITLGKNILFDTTGSNYNVLQMKLSDYLNNNNWSIEELNKLLARSVRAAGLYTKEAIATSAVALQTVLAQKYQIKLPYWWGGKSWSYGASSNWGRNNPKEGNGQIYLYQGLDCSGFITWTLVNAGYNIPSNTYPHSDYWGNSSGSTKLSLGRNNGNVGDWLVKTEHIKLIIGKTDTYYITAEAKGRLDGMVISVHEYSNSAGYSVVLSDNFMSKTSKYTDYPTGF